MIYEGLGRAVGGRGEVPGGGGGGGYAVRLGRYPVQKVTAVLTMVLVSQPPWVCVSLGPGPGDGSFNGDEAQTLVKLTPRFVPF